MDFQLYSRVILYRKQLLISCHYRGCQPSRQGPINYEDLRTALQNPLLEFTYYHYFDAFSRCHVPGLGESGSRPVISQLDRGTGAANRMRRQFTGTAIFHPSQQT